MRKCAQLCMAEEQKCQNQECRLWLNYEEDLNCTLIAVDKHGPMTLREISERENISFVRVKQIQDQALAKLKKRGSF
jgi:DNA-directed RNA polymerase sigma subunit (sigma70/sigma32)